MILAAYHPCYFPSISFVAAMQVADVFVLTDDFQYSTSYCINRAKIKTAEKARWMTIPVLTKECSGQSIKDVVINPDIAWTKKHFKMLCSNYAFAAYFGQFEDTLAKLFEKPQRYLLDFNFAILNFVRDVLKLDTTVILSSQLSIDGNGTQKLIEMTQTLNCQTYLTSQEFKDFLSAEDFESHGLKLEFFLDYKKPYHQLFGEFMPGLSVIDLILNEGVQASINYTQSVL